MAILQKSIDTFRPLITAKGFAPMKSYRQRRDFIQLAQNSLNEGVFYSGEARIGNTVKMLCEAPDVSNSPTGMNPGLTSTNVVQGNLGDGTAIAGTDPTLIAVLRRSAPTVIAYDLVHVQTLSQQTGSIFAMHPVMKNNVTGGNKHELWGGRDKSRAVSTNGAGVQDGPNQVSQVGGPDGWQTAVESSGENPLGTTVTKTTINGGTATTISRANLTTVQLENLNATTGWAATATAPAFKTVGFTISRLTVTAEGKALLGEYPDEILHDLKVSLGIDADSEIQNILSTQLIWEQNRDLIENIVFTAKNYGGATIVSGIPTVDLTNAVKNFGSFGSTERWKALVLHIELACIEVAQDARMGRANIALVAPEIASLLAMAGVLTPVLKENNISLDFADLLDSGSLVVGKLPGGQTVVVDPYAAPGSVVVMRKGQNIGESCMFFCPYVPIQLIGGIREPNNLHHRLAVKTRYGLAANPFSEGFLSFGDATMRGVPQIKNDQGFTQSSNVFSRKFQVVF